MASSTENREIRFVIIVTIGIILVLFSKLGLEEISVCSHCQWICKASNYSRTIWYILRKWIIPILIYWWRLIVIITLTQVWQIWIIIEAKWYGTFQISEKYRNWIYSFWVIFLIVRINYRSWKYLLTKFL